MKRFWHYLKQQAWFMALPLLFMTAYGTSALAAQAPSFSATASGAANNLSVTANINVSDADVGKMGNNYVGFNSNQTWYFHNGAGWASFNSGAVPIYAAAPLANRAIEVLRNQDVSDLIGGQLYVGYGLTESDMLANNKFGMVYTVTDTTAPTVTNTIHANGATNVATNTKVAVAFSETMDSSTINDANFTLKETVSTIAVTGIVSYSGVTATFIPIGNLAGNTGYTVTVKGGAHGAKDLAGNPLASDFSIGWTTGEAADVTAPTVTGTPHTNGATNVAVNTKIGATFSEGMDPLTITNANFTLKETVSGNTVAGTASYSGVSAVFVPSSILARSTGYTVTVKGGSGGVKDLAGNPLASDFVISWTTAATTDTTAPTVTGTMNANGATNVAYNTKVGIAFSEGMDPLTVTNLNFALKETVSGKPVAGTVSYSGTNATFIPTTGLAGFTGYTVTIKGGAGGIKDLAGNPLAGDFVIGWTTGAAPDTTAPTVTGTSNANNATDVAINTKIGATFSEAMDPLTMTNVNFTLKKTSDGSAVVGTVGYSGVNAVFIPLNNLSSGTRYTATVKGGANGVKDLAGNPLASDYVWSWNTADYIWEPSPTPPADSISPTVTGTAIANGATNVAINTAVGATFSEGMDPLTVTTANFTLVTTIGSAAVIGTVSNSGGNNWVFTPTSNLANSTGYTATITTGVKDLAGNALASNYVWSFTTGVPSGPAAINLLTAGNFAILTTTGITNTGSHLSLITGDIGSSPITGAAMNNVFCSELAAGNKIYGVNAAYVGSGDASCFKGTAPDKTLVDNAVGDMGTAYTEAAGRAAGVGATNLNVDGGTLNGNNFVPGTYTWGTDVNITGNITLTGAATDVWLFQMSGNLSLASAGSEPLGTKIVLAGGAKASNVFWQVGGGTGATLGTYATFNGNILSAAQVILQTGAILNGRALAGTQVTLDANPVTKPAP